MTVREAIAQADAIKPNAFTLETKLAWINSIEGTLAIEVFLLAREEIPDLKYTEDDLDEEMLAFPPYDDIYPMYLQAMIDLSHGEYDKYQNTMQVFNARRSGFIRYYGQFYDPVQGSCARPEEPPYYLSAYAIAVKHGYVGTEEEWLKSLRGETGSIQIKGEYATLEDLEEEHPVGDIGDCYLVGDPTGDYLIYWWNPETEEWDDIALRGESAYEEAVQAGYTGTKEQFMEELAELPGYTTAAEAAAALAQMWAAGTQSGTPSATNNAAYYADLAQTAMENMTVVFSLLSAGEQPTVSYDRTTSTLTIGLPQNLIYVTLDEYEAMKEAGTLDPNAYYAIGGPDV